MSNLTIAIVSLSAALLLISIQFSLTLSLFVTLSVYAFYEMAFKKNDKEKVSE